ncbi:MAG: PorT family protein, partial [Bacteroidia bacterium]|nr:PorT family protein [Bacteroidia bacterium]
MKIKSIIAIAVLATASISANAQVKFGLKAGVNFQNLNGKDISGAALANHVVVRYHAGFTLDIPVAEDFYVQSGLLFKTKGAKIDQTKVNLSYIELPITFMYKPKLGEGHLILGFGPYLAYGVGGKYSNDGNDYKV